MFLMPLTFCHVNFEQYNNVYIYISSWKSNIIHKICKIEEYRIKVQMAYWFDKWNIAFLCYYHLLSFTSFVWNTDAF